MATIASDSLRNIAPLIRFSILDIIINLHLILVSFKRLILHIPSQFSVRWLILVLIRCPSCPFIEVISNRVGNKEQICVTRSWCIDALKE